MKNDYKLLIDEYSKGYSDKYLMLYVDDVIISSICITQTKFDELKNAGIKVL